MKSMKDYKRLSEPLVKIPKSVQQMIPVASITEDGIARTEPASPDEDTTFDKAYLFADTNFSTMDDDEQDEFLQRYCLVLNSMNTDCTKNKSQNNSCCQQDQEFLFIINFCCPG